MKRVPTVTPKRDVPKPIQNFQISKMFKFQNEKKNLDVMNITHPEKLSRDLERLVNDVKTHDILFTFPNESNVKIYAHKAILASRSPKLRDYFRQNKEKTYIMQDRKYDIMMSFIFYVYTGVTVIDDHNVMDLLRIADFFIVDSLRLSCFDFLVKSVDMTTVCSMMVKAQRGEYDFKCRELITKCISFLEKNTLEILSSDGFLQFDEDVVLEILSSDKLCINEVDLFQHVLRWGNSRVAKTEDLPKILEKVTREIRYPLMKPHELIKIVKDHVGTIVPEDLYLAACEYNSSPEAVEKTGVMTSLQYKPRSSQTNFTWDISLNPSTFSVSNNGLTLLKTGKSSWNKCFALGNSRFKSGKQYFECDIDVCAQNGAGIYLGVTPSPTSSYYTRDLVVGLNGAKYNLNSTTGGASGKINALAGDTIGVLLDFSTLVMTFYWNGNATGITGTLHPKQEYTPVIHCYYQNDQVTLSFKPAPK